MNWRTILFVIVLAISISTVGCQKSAPEQSAATTPPDQTAATTPPDQAAQQQPPQPAQAGTASDTHKSGARKPSESAGLKLPPEGGRGTYGAPLTIPAGTGLHARIDDSISTAKNKAGDRFTASLAEPVVVNGRDVLPKGTRLTGHVTTSDSSGRLQGRAVIGVALDSIEYRGENIPITTSLDTRTSASHKKRNIEMIGGGSALGALIGGIAGGGKGAAIGAAAGAGAGTGTAYATGKREVSIPSETILGFRLKSPVTLKQ